MTLPAEKQHRLLDWLNQKGVRRDCIACGHEGWEVGDMVAPPATPRGGGTVVGGPSFPLVQVYCGNCGYVMHFNATRIGLGL